jgi:transcriptional regulator with XRE-family HTH domain
VIRRSHPILSNLGVTIRRLRRQRGLSQEALADLAHIDRSYMSSIERGRRNLSVLNVARIAGALRVPLCDLLYGQDGPVEDLQRAAVAVDEVAESLRLHHPPAGVMTPPASSDERAEAWKPGWYLSLS